MKKFTQMHQITSKNENKFNTYIVNGTNIILQSFFPIFEDKFIEQQINNSICVLERMIHICRR